MKEKDKPTISEHIKTRIKPSNIYNIAKALSLLFAISGHAECIAAETTIYGTETTTQGPVAPPLNGNDVLIITTSGSISVTGNNIPGVSGTGGSNQIINNGLIQTTGDGTGAGNADGINAINGSNTIINNGTISTTGNAARGIGASGNSNTITNNGSINTVLSTGINTDSSSHYNQITNNGSILTTGPDAEGIRVGGNSNTVTNTGSIVTTGDSTNPGEAAGINARGGRNTVTNSGTIVSHHGASIYFLNDGNTLNLENSSFLGGVVHLGSGTQINISTGANYSKVVNYTGTLSGMRASGSLPVFINRATQQLATYDPTIFAASSDALADMTKTIASLSPERFGGTEKSHPFWAKAFGIASSYSGSEATLERKYNYSGVGIGYDILRTNTSLIGVLGGYGKTSISTNGTEMQSYNNASDDGFWGIYAEKSWQNLWINFGLYGGVQDFNQQRYINDNLAYLGNSSAQASFSGWWISPQVAVTYKAGELGGWSILPTASLSYSNQWMNSYTETGGSTANATVHSRSLAVGQSFVGIGTKKSIKTNTGKNTKLVLDGQVGYLYRGTTGNQTAAISMIGQSLSIPTEAESRNTFAATAGMSIDLSSAVALKIRADATTGGGMNYVGGGWAGLSIQF